MEPLALAQFAEVEGEAFWLAADESLRLPFKLARVRELPQPAFQGRTPFTLLFEGPPEPVLPQRIYRLSHERMPALEIFLVPVAADARHVAYEAVFA